MKETGIIRKIDSMGRIVLPAELRKTMDINKADYMEVYVEGNNIIFEKSLETCVFCGSEHHIVHYQGKGICQDCINRMIQTHEEKR